jgi:ribosomal protein L17
MVSEKLTNSNHALWKMQMLAIIKGDGLEGYLTGAISSSASTIRVKDHDSKEETEVLNLDLQSWKVTNQQVLRFLLSCMTKDVLSQVTVCRAANEAWKVIEGIFTSAKRARTVNSRIALAMTKKEELSVVEYISKMRFLGDELIAAGKQIDDDELISYIFAGLDQEYNSVITTLLVKETLTIGDVYSLLLNFE